MERLNRLYEKVMKEAVEVLKKGDNIILLDTKEKAKITGVKNKGSGWIVYTVKPISGKFKNEELEYHNDEIKKI